MARLVFERGDPDHPVGHAFLVFRIPGEVDMRAATYLVVPPIAIDFAKYVPPLLASSLGASGLIAQTSFLPVPPAPERVPADDVQRMAEARGDDVLDGGTGGGLDIASLMGLVAEIGDAYARAYRDAEQRMPRVRPDPEPTAATPALAGMAVLYSLLSEHERVEELARRVGTLRYAVEGGDLALAESTEAEMRAIGAYLPEAFRFDELMAAARRPGRLGTRLAQLYIDRSYKLAAGARDAVGALDAEIAALRERTMEPNP